MNCRRCPHHVRHGQLAEGSKDKPVFVFKDICGLRHKQSLDPETVLKKTKVRSKSLPDQKRKPLPQGVSLDCQHVPFTDTFDYFSCEVYQEHFASQGFKNGAIPTSDISYGEHLASVSLTDMELL